LVISVPVYCQTLSTGRLIISGTGWDGVSGALIGTAETTPLVIANLSPVGQPIRLLGGDNGATTALEIGAAADVWIRGPLSVGQFTGAGLQEIMRIGSILATNGIGLVVDLIGSSTSTGLVVRSIGLSGSDNAGIILQSVANGFGTGMRFGGPTGSGRPVLSTGIDITGGVGVRYNALNSGTGTAYEIGGTTAPLKGIEVTTAGAANAGVTAKANSNGVGVIGTSLSGSYTVIPATMRTGVHGYAATNSNIGSDTIVGTLGTTVRGGSGGTATTSIGILGRTTSSGTSHAGTAIGVVGTASANSPGIANAIGGFFTTEPSSQSLSLVAIGSDNFLGSAVHRIPIALSSSTITSNTLSTTFLYSTDISGTLQLSSLTNSVLAVGANDDVVLGPGVIIKVTAQNLVSQLTGIANGTIGRLVTLLCVNGIIRVMHENVGSIAANRIRIPNGLTIDIGAEGSITLWYDSEINRWRTLNVE